jgi:hypothetical protein
MRIGSVRRWLQRALGRHLSAAREQAPTQGSFHDFNDLSFQP